ncbi:protein-disulfide reductase DsbD domain-containing protein [Flavobacterium ajazii]|uniref:protein-disulfide reductase DsbD domain-containing protein n=1 Tax=Flavobacterium ajazii TaxID=2692318 RepID=UPI0013D77FED|nr:protein-disulfide reductase DsbD domain-containing protein [Flavobacterium ajazii]
MNVKCYLIACLFAVKMCWGQDFTVQPKLKAEALEKVKSLKTEITNDLNPVEVNADVVWSEDKTQLAVVLKASINAGWHIYAFVPDTEPYVVTEVQFDVPEGFTKCKKVEYSRSKPYDNGVYIYEDQPYFIQYYKIDTINKGIVNAGLYFQVCDARKCYPPVLKSKEITLN